MADARPTPQALRQIVLLCLYGAFAPTRLAKLEAEDNDERNQFRGKASVPHRAFVVARALWTSLFLVVASILAGIVFGMASHWAFGIPSKALIAALQLVGAGLLLWGTLFVRGWEIQTYSGVTLTERVNQWLYRSLYCIGTTVLIWATYWAW